tara:strand:+ start:580 stop:1740 length:1161 start_codon:yes stop_codon:yes gene_type:complete
MYYNPLAKFMQKKEHSKLAVSLKSSGRIYKEKNSFFRSPYQRDRDRIVHSTAFRRLKHKTQVFVNTTGDHFRTRITHSLEVSQIARTIAKIFNLNEDLCETLCLAHDLGHTPFGHAGEESLNECMQMYGGFNHNIQTIRIVTLLEKKYYKFNGLNLSLETLDGLIKHNGPVFDLTDYEKILGHNFFKNKINFSLEPSLEAQISSISDDIAYNSHDLEDGLNSKLFKIDDLKDIPVLDEIIKKHKKFYKKTNSNLISRQIIRDIINEMVKDIVNNTSKNIKSGKYKNLKDIHNAKTQLVCFSNKMNNFDISIKEFLKQNMYYSQGVLTKTNEGRKMVKTLFNSIRRKPKKFISKDHFKKNVFLERLVSDFIAGMTDRYAINLYNSIR